MEGELDDEELQRAFRMSLQPMPEAKRSKSLDESSEAMERRVQREIRAAAAEKRRVSSSSTRSPASLSVNPQPAPAPMAVSHSRSGELLSLDVADKMFGMVFGLDVSRDILAQWSNQGFRFSPDPETSLGLVQHEGGPCGVLAAVQATVLKYLLFVSGSPSDGRCLKTEFKDVERTRALVEAMGEILWRAGESKIAVLAVLDLSAELTDHQDQEKALEGVSLNSADGLREGVRTLTVSSLPTLQEAIRQNLESFRSRLGALLFLFSALLSRGLESVKGDRDDALQPLVTPPFGHASQEIVNLLLCGQAVANVFDGNYDLGSGLCLKGIPAEVEVGFLTLLESLNFCKVGQNLKRPKWPIWVVGSESHYTVLFALDTSVQDENEVEAREARVRAAFDAHDQSGGGGFISIEALQEVLGEMSVDMPPDMFNNLCSSDIVVWNELWQALFELEKSRGGFKDEEGANGKKYFEIYHFNGIAKTVAKTVAGSSETMHQRPRLTKLRVSVPPKWTPESMMITEGPTNMQTDEKKEEPAQHCPLADCIRTRWQRATCNWTGDPPSIV